MFKNILSISFLAVLACNVVLANPVARDEDDDHRNGGDDRCLSSEQGDKILSTWINFFVNPVRADVAAQYLTPEFHYFSESTNSISPGKGDTVSHYPFITSIPPFIHQQTPLTSSLPQSQAAKVSAPIAIDIPSFIASQSFNDGTSAFTVIAKAYSCDTITFRWQFSSLTAFPVSGLDLLFLSKDRGRFRIKTVYSEFNTVAFLVAVGQFPTPCT
jgi:hypothetical protein